MNNKKVAIVTMCGHYNHGNRLQNYALQEAIKKNGFDVETLWPIEIIPEIKTLAKIFFPRKWKKAKRYINFKKFSKKYITTKKVIWNKRTYNKINKEYDYFVVGSDQVWNPFFVYGNNSFGGENNAFLKFSSKEKNIAYAPSFGINKLPEKYIESYKDGLDNFKYLSCREDEGKNIIESVLKNKKIDRVLDPTFLLSLNEWKDIMECSTLISSKKYILMYFLGDITKQAKEDIEQYSKINDCEVVDLNGDFSNEIYTTSPSQFVWLINNAEIIFTDSFHGAVFSIIFNKEFYVFKREQKDIEDMSSRIESLVNIFKLNDRYINRLESKIYTTINYDNVNKILEEERKKSNIFLGEALGIKNEIEK